MKRLIADSGSTKTSWCLMDGGAKRYFTTQGINPFQQTEEQMTDVLRNEVMPLTQGIDELFFYGAGCTKEKSVIVRQVFQQLLGKECSLSVESDLLGAARALCQREAGVVGILGTGSNSGLYDGVKIVRNVSPLGFILGDEGSGAYIGKRLVGNCLKHQFSDELCQLFLEETDSTPADIIQRVYREHFPNRYLASLSEFCARHLDQQEIHGLLVDCFREFFVRNVALYQQPKLPVHFVGSIAWHYREILEETARACGYQTGQILQAPIEGLAEYHSVVCR